MYVWSKYVTKMQHQAASASPILLIRRSNFVIGRLPEFVSHYRLIPLDIKKSTRNVISNFEGCVFEVLPIKCTNFDVAYTNVGNTKSSSTSTKNHSHIDI